MNADTMTPAEAAVRLGVTRQAVFSLIHSGALPHSRSSDDRISRYLIPARAVEDRVADRSVPEGWVSLPAAAEARGVDDTTIRNWVRAGRVEALSTVHGRFVSLEAVMMADKRRPGPRGNRPDA